MTTTPKQEAHTATPVYSWQFDPLDDSGRVSITLNGTVIAEVQSIKSAQTMCRMLSSHDALVTAVEDLLFHIEHAHPEEKDWDFPTRARRALELARTPTPGEKP